MSRHAGGPLSGTHRPLLPGRLLLSGNQFDSRNSTGHRAVTNRPWQSTVTPHVNHTRNGRRLMNREEAKRVLWVYREGIDDNDPAFADALKEAGRDPELALWLKQ